MIQVINRAFDILEFLAKEPERHRSLTEIAEALNLNAGTCANIIKTMVGRKYIEKVDKKKGYCLGPMAYGLTGNESYKKDLTTAARDELDQITAKLNENSLLAVLHNEMRLILLRAESTQPLQASTPVEKRAYDAATGRLLVAMLPDAELQRFTDKYGLPKEMEWEGVSDEKTFLSAVKKIRKEGFAIQLTKQNIVGLAVPVYSGEKIVASISIYLPELRYNKSDKKGLVELLKESSRRITAKMS
ncbi:IclR family transcriptional regulator [Desertivirga xinjiangensis]|uniref:IclR family transcriptional regulator n=1 Tax=Desertivirga xinjiangensis TaxID=539206 RepID=UPI00210A5B5C|nr:IclR family transcriptional regulator [Pedobacter xinjiangensis]